MERETRFELATPTLARLYSTTELFPLVEAASRFELENGGFADLCLTTWLCRRNLMERETRFELATPTLARLYSTTELFPLDIRLRKKTASLMKEGLKFWSGKRDLNSRLQPWQGCTLPLSYSRSGFIFNPIEERLTP